MQEHARIDKGQSLVLWSALGLYLAGRICQLFADRLPTLTVVLLHVAPPAIFAVVHGSIVYRPKGFAVFSAFCLGIGATCETVSLRTGFPFGHYAFTDVMGPKLFQLPLLLVLAYLGIGYISWVLALQILGYRDKPLVDTRVLAVPVLASFILLAWDLSTEADWSTVDRAWRWEGGGAYFGVPVSNFLGWYLTAFLFYGAFALYLRKRTGQRVPRALSFWRSAILMYAICAAGNLLLLRKPMAPAVVIDPSGKSWSTSGILAVGSLMSIVLMGPISLLAWLRLEDQEG